MKHKQILNTLLTYWSVPDECFVTESSYFPRTAGTGDSASESRENFQEMLLDILDDYEQGNVLGVSAPGRPPKNGVDLHVKVRKATKLKLDRYREEMGLSQGEFIDHLLSMFEIHSPLDETKSSGPPAAVDPSRTFVIHNSSLYEGWYGNASPDILGPVFEDSPLCGFDSHLGMTAFIMQGKTSTRNLNKPGSQMVRRIVVPNMLNA